MHSFKAKDNLLEETLIQEEFSTLWWFVVDCNSMVAKKQYFPNFLFHLDQIAVLKVEGSTVFQE